MPILTSLQVHNNPNAPYIILVFIALTAALYCLPTLYRLVRSRHSLNELNAQESKDDAVFVCHDEAFLQRKA